MHENFFDFLLLGHLQQGEEMPDVRVHAPIAQQTEEMQLTLATAFHRLLKERNILQLLLGDEQINPRDIHVHDAPRAHVHVAYFAVAHLPFGQTHEGAGGVNQGVGEFFEQFVIGWLARKGNRVAFCFSAVSPAV